MAAFTPFNQQEELGVAPIILVGSDAINNHQAILEIDDYARSHGYVRSRENALNVRQNLQGMRYYYSACYLLDEDDLRAAETDLKRIRERRERMPVTTSSNILLREDD